MTKLDFSELIIDDGIYVFPQITPCAEYVIEVSGQFDSGTATLGYVSGSGAFVAFPDPMTADTDLTADADKAATVVLPRSGKFAITLSGATSPSLKFSAERI